MKSQREMLTDEIFLSLKSMLLGRTAATTVWLDLDLTIGQIKGIFMLAYSGPMTVGQVAEALGIGKPAASILVDRLVHISLADRTEDAVDRRRAIIRLTTRGEDLVTQLLQGRRELLQDALGRMSDKDLEALAQGLRALVSSISANRLVSQP